MRSGPDEASAASAPTTAQRTRRSVCGQLLAAASLPMFGGCAAARSTLGGGGEAALLLPLSGAAQTLGRNMERAASLVAAAPDAERAPVYDTRDTVEGARIAARAALDGGARMLFGPLRADQTPAVVAEAGDVPVVTFSNDDRLAAQGAFVMGVTPAQSVATAFSYARAQGVGRVALVARSGALGEASALAAREIAAAGGLTLTAVLLRDSPGAIAADLRAGGPDAVFLPDGGADLVAFATALSGSGLQLMGGVQWGVQDVAGVPALAGAWFAAPPPASFLPFLNSFESRFGEAAGVVTALGYDAALTAAALSDARRMNRAGLTREAGFAGALGGFRFLEDGRCRRDLAVLTIENGAIVTIGEVTGT